MKLTSSFIKARGAAYAGGGLTADRVTRAEQFSSEVSDKNRNSFPACWGLGVGLTFPPHKNFFFFKSRQ